MSSPSGEIIEVIEEPFASNPNFPIPSKHFFIFFWILAIEELASISRSSSLDRK